MDKHLMDGMEFCSDSKGLKHLAMKPRFWRLVDNLSICFQVYAQQKEKEWIPGSLRNC